MKKKEKKKKIKMAIGLIYGTILLCIYIWLIFLVKIKLNLEGFWITLPFVAMMAVVATLSSLGKKDAENELVITPAWKEELDDESY